MSTPKKVAVVAHRRKNLGGGLDELRRRLSDEGVKTLLWYEVPKSRKAPKQIGKLAYVWTGLRNVDGAPARAKIRVDGVDWFDDEASCVLVGNVGTITGGIEAFDDARPDDGWLDVGVATAHGAAEWARTLGTM